MSNDNTEESHISIEDFKEFEENNRDFMQELDFACSYVSDMYANVSSINATIEDINECLSKVKSVDVPTVPTPDELLTSINVLVEEFSIDTTKILGGLLYFEEQAKLFSKGKITESELVGIDKLVSDSSNYGLTWIANAFIQNTPFTALKFLSNVATYGADAQYSNGHFLEGDVFSGIFKDWVQKSISSPKACLWINAAIGSVAVMGLTALIDCASDLGDFVMEEDGVRVALDTAIAGITYVEWTVIAGSISGPVGTVVAAAVVVPTALILGSIKDSIVGDNVIDEFTRVDKNGNEVTYKVEQNGHGNNATFDAYVELLREKKKDHIIGDYKYSEKTFKTRLYDNWEEVLQEDIPNSYDVYTDNTDINAFNSFLEDALLKENEDDALNAFMDSVLADPSNGCYALYEKLARDYDFDICEYYNYVKNKGNLEEINND